MSHQPRKYFVVVLFQDVPRIVIASNMRRHVEPGQTLEQVVRPSCPGWSPLLGWRTFAGADKHRGYEPCDNDDRAAGWAVKVYERRQGKLEPT